MAKEKRVAKRRREDEETALVLADLQAQLEASEERADNAEAKADVLKTDARKKSDALRHSFSRARKSASGRSKRPRRRRLAFVGCLHLHRRDSGADQLDHP